MGRTRISLKVKQTGKGLDEIKRRLKQQVRGGAINVKAGFLGRDEERPTEVAEDGTPVPSDMTNPRLAAIHEFGAPEVGIPARPFVSAAFDENQRTYEAQLRRVCTALASRPISVGKALNLIGSGMAADIRNFVTQGEPIAPENAESVKRRKAAKQARDEEGNPAGEVRTLVDTGRLIGSVSWAVTKGKAGDGVVES